MAGRESDILSHTHCFSLSSPVFHGDAVQSTVLYSMNGAAKKLAIAFFAQASGMLGVIKIGAHTAGLIANNLIVSIYENSDNGFDPSSTLVGSVTLQTPSGGDGSVFTLNMLSGNISLTKATRYWAVFSFGGYTSGSLNFRNIASQVNVNTPNLADLMPRKDDGAGWTYIVYSNSTLRPFITFQIEDVIFGFPVGSMGGIGSFSYLNSASYGNTYCFITGFDFNLNISGLKLSCRRFGSPPMNLKYRVQIGGINYDTNNVSMPPLSVAANGIFITTAYFEKSVLVPRNTPIGLSVVSSGETPVNVWTFGTYNLWPEAKDMEGWKIWNGWSNDNGVITQNRCPVAEIILSPMNPFPSELNRRQFFNAR